MGILDSLSGVLQRATSGKAGEGEVTSAFDQVAGSVPSSDLADGIAHTFKSDQTPAFEQMVSGLYSQSSGEQKAGILNKLLATLGGGGVAQALSGTGAGGGMGGIASMLTGGNVSPQQAQQVPPEAMQALAQHAARRDPSIMDQAASFYSQHPGLVKTLGAGALTVLMSKISSSRR